MMLPLTKKQVILLHTLIDTYVDSAAENGDNRNDLRLAKRIRWRIERLWAEERAK